MNFELPIKEIERRKQVIRDVWEYRKVDHIPVLLSIQSNPFGYTMHEELLSMEKQLQMRLESIRRSLELVPDDYIPAMFANVGCVAIENAYGMEMFYGHSSAQTPSVKAPLLDDIEKIYTLKRIDPHKDGILPAFLKRIRYFVEQTDSLIPVTCLDMNGSMAIAMDILGSESFLLGMYTEPEKIRTLLDFIVDDIIKVTDACIDAAGGLEMLTSTDFVGEWFPEGRKGHVSDDVCAMYSPELFQEIAIPVYNRIFERYGPGMIHNCGPNPCMGHYLGHTPRIGGADLNFQYSRADLPKFKKAFSRKGILYLGMDFSSEEQTICDYQYIIDSLSPEVIAIPSVVIDETDILSGKCDVKRLYEKLRRMSTVYSEQIFG